MTLQEFKKKGKKLPDAPGVYFFLGKRKEVLYIGKATSLRSRVRSYFAPDLGEARGPLVTHMIAQACSIDWRQTDSVLEALILEANLIKTHKPKANTDLKDDKSWNYVVITTEDFPSVLLIRGRELRQAIVGFADKVRRTALRAARPSLTVRQTLPASPNKVFGPFPHGLQLKEALKLVRKSFPYRDTCVPSAGKRCFNAQIGLCPGVCSGEITKTEYKKIVRRIVLLFQGKKRELLRDLWRDMKAAAKEERFEEAARLRRQVFALKHIQDVSLIKQEYRSPSTTLGAMHQGRIEAYDVAHLGGSAVVGVMVVVDGGEAQRGEYRKFKINTTKGGDDTGALREILSRRLGHNEWPMPRLIVVDGAAAQVNAAEAVLKHYGVRIPVVGVVKDEKHRPRNIQGLEKIRRSLASFDNTQDKSLRVDERDILLANAEAHRFAISYHRKKLRKSF